MRKPIHIVLILLLFITCTKVEIGEIENLNNGKIDVFGHGGLSFDHPFQPMPFNSWEALRFVIESTSADGVEVDVQITADSVAMIFHDSFLEGSTTCEGCIPLVDQDQLANCNYLAGFPSEHHELEEVQRLLKFHEGHELAPLIYLDSKTSFNCLDEVATQSHLQRMALAYWQLISIPERQNRVWIIAGNTILIGLIHALDPSIRIYLITSNFPSGIQSAMDLSCFGIIATEQDITKNDVKMAHDNGLMVNIWGVGNAQQHIDAIKKNPDHIISDNISIALGLLH